MSDTHWYKTTRIEAYAVDLLARKQLVIDVVEEEISLMASGWDAFACSDPFTENHSMRDAYVEYIRDKD